MGFLRVFQIPEGSNDAREFNLLITISGNQGPGWTRAVTPLTTPGPLGSFYLSLEATTGSGYLSDIAVDNIELLQGKDICQEALEDSGAVDAEDSGVVHMNPASCFKRCFKNASAIAEVERWEEGACDCSTGNVIKTQKERRGKKIENDAENL